jgi:hypothetical protein
MFCIYKKKGKERYLKYSKSFVYSTIFTRIICALSHVRNLGCVKYVNTTLQNVILHGTLWLGKLCLHNIKKEMCCVRNKHDFEPGSLTVTFTFSRHFQIASCWKFNIRWYRLPECTESVRHLVCNIFDRGVPLTVTECVYRSFHLLSIFSECHLILLSRN